MWLVIILIVGAFLHVSLGSLLQLEQRASSLIGKVRNYFNLSYIRSGIEDPWSGRCHNFYPPWNDDNYCPPFIDCLFLDDLALQLLLAGLDRGAGIGHDQVQLLNKWESVIVPNSEIIRCIWLSAFHQSVQIMDPKWAGLFKLTVCLEPVFTCRLNFTIHLGVSTHSFNWVSKFIFFFRPY